MWAAGAPANLEANASANSNTCDARVPAEDGLQEGSQRQEDAAYAAHTPECGDQLHLLRETPPLL